MASSTIDLGNGITQGYNGRNEIINQAMTAFTAIAWANCVELTVLILLVFKRYSGIYFWSLLISTLSVIPYSYGAWSKQVPLSYNLPRLLPVGFLNISWAILIPGQSIVLWSRLHLITHNQKLLSFILWLIIINWFVFAIPTTVFTWGSNLNPHMVSYVRGYSVFEKIQMVAFSAQEIFISGVYLFEVRKILKLVHEKHARKLMWELLAINVFIITLDVALLAVEFMNMYQVETTFKGMVYSIKLKLEFGVLSKLVKVALQRKDSHGRIQSRGYDTEGPVVDLEDLPSTTPRMYSMTVSADSHQGHFDSYSRRKDSASARYIENMTRDMNLPPEWRRNHSEEYGSSSRIDEEAQSTDTRPTLGKRDSQLSDFDMAYPGRLDHFVPD